VFSTVVVASSSSWIGQKNSSLEIMIYSFFKQELFFFLHFFQLYSLVIFYDMKKIVKKQQKNLTLFKAFFNAVKKYR